MAKSTISPALLCGEENNISKKICKKSICVSLFLILLSVVIYVLVKLLGFDSNSTIFLTLVSFAILLLVFGLIKMFHNNCLYVCNDTQSTLHGYVVYVATGTAQEALRYINAKAWEKLSQLVIKGDSSAKIELVVSADLQFARCQVFAYVPYNFEPFSDVINLSPEDAQALLKLAK